MTDLSEMTSAELAALITEATQLLHAMREQEKTDGQNLRTSIGDEIETLIALIGPEDAEAGSESIRAVRKFSPEDMATYPEVAFPLAFLALEVLAQTTLDIAKVIASGAPPSNT